MNTTLPIFEMFTTFQGEGIHMGRPAFFVRTYGCPLRCNFCDAAGTWHPNWVPAHIERMDVASIAQEALGSQTGRVVITGGEPTIFDLNPLTDALYTEELDVHLETSGSFPIKGEFDWITLSPKKWKVPLKDSVALADEFKVIVESADDIGFYWKMLRDLGLAFCDRRPVWLHPEWSKREDPTVLNAISTAVKEGRGTFRAGWQLHKLYRIDALDARSRPLVPLGGDTRRGY